MRAVFNCFCWCFFAKELVLMNVRMLALALLTMLSGSSVCFAQTPVPMKDGNGKTWWYGPNGITPGPYVAPNSRQQAPVHRQPQRRPAPVPEHYAANLGIHFKLVRIGGASGARVTREPDANAAASQRGLEPGDTIFMLDGRPIRSADDVRNHYAETTVDFINVRTGGAERCTLMLPTLHRATGKPSGQP
jgi:PDZ domain